MELGMSFYPLLLLPESLTKMEKASINYHALLFNTLHENCMVLVLTVNEKPLVVFI